MRLFKTGIRSGFSQNFFSQAEVTSRRLCFFSGKRYCGSLIPFSFNDVRGLMVMQSVIHLAGFSYPSETRKCKIQT